MSTDFIERVQMVLKEKDISQKDMADMIGIRRENFTYWKNAGIYPSCDILLKMSDILNVDLKWLITGEYSTKEGLTEKEKELLQKYNELEVEEKKLIDNLLYILTKKKIPSPESEGI